MKPVGTTPEEEAAVEAVADGILNEVIVEEARGIHRDAKTGVLPYDEIMAGSDGAPSSTGGTALKMERAPVGDCEAKDGEGKVMEGDVQPRTRGLSEGSHATTQAPTGAKSEGDGATEEAADADEPDAKKTKIEGDETEEKVGEGSASPIKGSATHTPASPLKAYTDIYGRTPGKEPPYPVPCPNCRRSLSASRMASHLEKCLGISTRSAARKSNSASSGGSKGSNSKGSPKGSGRGGKATRGKQAKRKSSKIVA